MTVMSGSESSARTLGLFAMDTNQVEKAAFGSDGLETQQLTRRIIALKEAVLSNDQAIAALTGGASASASDAVGTREVASGGWNATDPKSLTAVLKAQLAELHEVLQDKERAIQALRLKARFTRSGELALQTRAFIEEAAKLRLLIAECKAGGAGKRHQLMESLRLQSSAMAASHAETTARREEAISHTEKCWELLSACSARLMSGCEPLGRSCDAMAREHAARAAALARFSGPDAAKAVWLQILSAEVGAVRREAQEQAQARQREAVSRAEAQAELEARLALRRQEVAREEEVVRQMQGEVRQAAGAAQLAHRRSRALEKEALGSRHEILGASASGAAGASLGWIGAADATSGASRAQPHVAVGKKPGQSGEPSVGAAAAGGAKAGQKAGQKAERGARAPGQAAAAAASAAHPAEDAAGADRALLLKHGGNTRAAETQLGLRQGLRQGLQGHGAGEANGAPKPTPPLPSSPSVKSMSELQRYQLLLSKWSHRLDKAEKAGGQGGAPTEAPPTEAPSASSVSAPGPAAGATPRPTPPREVRAG